MGSINRPPDLPDAQIARLAVKISKATWIEIYRDLYIQTHGGDCSEEEWWTDVITRKAILCANGMSTGR